MKRLRTAAAGAATLLLLAALSWQAWPAAWYPVLVGLNRASAGLSPRVVQAAGHTIHLLEGGQGEPVVLLHGIFAEKDHWVDIARPLTNRWRVIAPDLPGFGESTRDLRQPYDYAAQVERLRLLLDAMGLQRVHLAGNSMGGTIAALFAIRHPQRVASVAFIGAPHGIRTPGVSAMDREITAGRAPLVASDAPSFDAALALVFSRPPYLPGPIVAVARAHAIERAAGNLQLWREQLGQRYLLHAQVGALRAPTLALWGGADRVFDASGAPVLAGLLPQAQVEVLPGLGHLPMMEAPGEVAARYDRFLGGLR